MKLLVQPEAAPRGHVSSLQEDLAVLTLVLWMTCVVVGLLGFAWPYVRPRPPAPPTEAVVVQQLQVELTAEPVPPPEAAPPPPPDPLAPPPPGFLPPPVPRLAAVAQPDPAIAFALPVAGPARIVELQRADHLTPVVPSAAPAAGAPPAPQPLTFGQGEGKQPAPEYPRLSVRQGQEGVVVVRLGVDADGRVQSAEVASPSPWPLLNDAALRAVRERWRFRSGPPRLYEVPIRFELTK